VHAQRGPVGALRADAQAAALGGRLVAVLVALAQPVGLDGLRRLAGLAALVPDRFVGRRGAVMLGTRAPADRRQRLGLGVARALAFLLARPVAPPLVSTALPTILPAALARSRPSACARCSFSAKSILRRTTLTDCTTTSTLSPSANVRPDRRPTSLLAASSNT